MNELVYLVDKHLFLIRQAFKLINKIKLGTEINNNKSEELA